MPDETPTADVVDEPAAALHESAEEAHETAEELHNAAESTQSFVTDTHEEARAHEEHAETRELAANAIDDVCHRLDRIEQHLHIGERVEEGAGEATGDIENVGTDAVDVVAEPAAEVEETTEVHTRRRRAFGKARRR